MQVSSRLLLVWGICTPPAFTERTTTSTFYTTMLFAWAPTEIVRYLYFFWTLQIGGGSSGSGKSGAQTRSQTRGIETNVKAGKVPGWLIWLRYNSFWVLYPLGITSECTLILKAQNVAAELEGQSPAVAAAAKLLGSSSSSYGMSPGQWGLVKWGLRLVLAIYVPGSWILYTHMMAQRRKVARGKGKEG